MLVISGANDVFYGGESPIYQKKNGVTNYNCSFERKAEDKHDNHYDYFLTDEAVAYQKKVLEKGFTGEVQKNAFAEHDETFMNHLNSFFVDALVMG